MAVSCSLATGVGDADAVVPVSSSGGAYTVRSGADGTSPSGGQPWEGVSRAGGRLRGGSNGLGAYFVRGDSGVDPQFGDRQGWRLALPSGVRLTTFSLNVSTGSWVPGRWTSGLRYTLAATDADGRVLGSPFLQCQPTALANDCPAAFRSDASRTFTAPEGTRRLELMVECVLAAGCSRFANLDGGPGGNEYAAVEGGTFSLVDDKPPALTSGFGELWTEPGRWFHNSSDPAAAGIGATDNAGVSRLQWYVDGSLAYDTGGATAVFALPCDFAFLEPCNRDTLASFALRASLFTIPDGQHELAVVAIDAAGNVSPALRRQFRLDDGAPPKVDVRVREGSELRDPGPWHLDFTVPPERDGAPLEGAWYRFCTVADPGDCTDAGSVREGIDGRAPGASASIEVSPPAPGEWTVRLWLGDQAGNASEANASDPALIRYGQSAPVADPDHPPSLSGDFVDGGHVRVSASGFAVAGAVDYSFQWQRCSGSDGSACVDVVGASAQDYVLAHADAGHRMRARVTALNAKGTGSAVSAASAPVASLPPSHGRALLSGTMRAGEELRVADVGFDGTPPFGFTYAWLRCSSGACDAIAGADGVSYALRDDDIGQTIRAVVTASNPAGSSAAEASRAGGEEAVAPAPPRSVAAPDAPLGVRVVGHTLTARDGDWAGSQPIAFSFVWQRCAGASGGCVAIAGADGRSYELAPGDAGKAIRVLVTARNGGDPVGPVASARTSLIEAAPVELPGGPSAPGPSGAPATAPSGPPASGPPEPPAVVPPPADLSKIPGNLVGPATCKVVKATPRKRSAKLRGVGRVTFAAAVPQRVTVADPLVLTVKARRGRARSVSYRIRRRAVGRARRAPYRVAVKPKSLRAGGTQALTALVTSREKGPRKPGRVTMRLNVAECPSLLTAGLRFSGARAITQLRVFSRTSIRSGALTLPAKLVPAVKAGKRAGTLTLTRADGRPVAKPLVARSRGRLLAAGGVSIRRSGRTTTFGGIPAGTGIVQIDLFGPRRAALRLLRGKKPLRFTAKVRADALATQRLLATIRGSAPHGRRHN